jgi:hypothetical protein
MFVVHCVSEIASRESFPLCEKEQAQSMSLGKCMKSHSPRPPAVQTNQTEKQVHTATPENNKKKERKGTLVGWCNKHASNTQGCAEGRKHLEGL